MSSTVKAALLVLFTMCCTESTDTHCEILPDTPFRFWRDHFLTIRLQCHHSFESKKYFFENAGPQWSHTDVIMTYCNSESSLLQPGETPSHWGSRSKGSLQRDDVGLVTEKTLRGVHRWGRAGGQDESSLGLQWPRLVKLCFLMCLFAGRILCVLAIWNLWEVFFSHQYRRDTNVLHCCPSLRWEQWVLSKGITSITVNCTCVSSSLSPHVCLACRKKCLSRSRCVCRGTRRATHASPKRYQSPAPKVKSSRYL